MSNHLYVLMQNQADRVIKKFGQPASLKSIGTSTYNPLTGAVSNTPVVSAVIAAVFPYDQKFIDGTAIQSGDLRAYLSPKPTNLVIAQGDQLTINGRTFSIIEVRPINPGGANMLWQLQLRQ